MGSETAKTLETHEHSFDTGSETFKTQETNENTDL